MGGLIIGGFLVVQLSKQLPDAQSIKNIQLKVPLRVYSADGFLISEFGNERRRPIAIDDAPQELINAVLAAEDDAFYQHQGIDISGLFRAAFANFRTGSSGQGASTITMQVARNFYLTPEKTYTRKIKEILLALKLEQILSKDEILSLYLNKIFLGHRAYGFGAAADVYYGKSLDQLSVAQIAMLAGLPKAPSSYNPLRNPGRAVQRRNYVLGRLKTLDLVTDEQYESAIAEAVTAEKHSRNADLVAPHIAEMVRAQLTQKFGEEAYWHGLNVYTTILSTQQKAAEKALRNGLQAYDRRHGFRGPIARVDISNIEIDPEHPEENYIALIRGYPNSQEQIPALVVSASAQAALLQTVDEGKIEISLESAKWAKRHLTANRVGDVPSSMADLVTPGDVVYVKPVNQAAGDQQTSAPEERQWQLSQIPNVGGALISMEPANGRILSLVGGYDFFLNKYNRAVQSIRQPGSNIKPFIYSAALDQGFTPASLVSGAPIVMTDPAHGTVWRPENYSGTFYGPTRIREALSKSMNLVSIRLLRAIGVPTAREYVSRFGIDVSRFSPTLTMALGTGGVTPLEMLTAYSSIANGGYKIKPFFIDRITDRDGRVIYLAEQPEYCDECYAQYLPQEEEPADTEGSISDQNDAEMESEIVTKEIDDAQAENTEDTTSEAATIEDTSDQPATDPFAQEVEFAELYQAPRIMSWSNNFLTVSMMRDVVKRGTARKALALNRQDLAGKTGTTNDYVDAWFTGFNSKVATTVWLGFDNPSSMGRGEAGSLAALPIWVDYMSSALKGVAQDSEEIPEFIEQGYVNRDTGQPTDELDPNAVEEFFVVEELLPELERKKVPSLDQDQDSDLGLEIEQEEEIEPLNPNQRVIEQSPEETEGLF